MHENYGPVRQVNAAGPGYRKQPGKYPQDIASVYIEVRNCVIQFAEHRVNMGAVKLLVTTSRNAGVTGAHQ
jgi:hypothetical protein